SVTVIMAFIFHSHIRIPQKRESERDLPFQSFSQTSDVGVIIKQNSTNLQKRKLPIQEQLENFSEQHWNPKYYTNLEDKQGQKD
uniref:Uncharacterized protein n=1 Tax=Taeniopygia guttata TaxID=59729 RepID=A0A674GG73_TAEGU